MAELVIDDPELARVLDQVPELSAAGRVVTAIEGGLTNRNYRVRTGAGDYVVRISVREAGQLGIDRANEHRSSVLAWQAGVGVGVVARVLEPGGARRAVRRRGARSSRRTSRTRGGSPCSRTCSAGSTPASRSRSISTWSQVQRRYHEIVVEHGYPLPGDYALYADRGRRLAEVLTRSRTRTAPCHNDLMPGNFIEVDGPGSRIWLIDYEYSGNNDPCYDLGDAINELLLDPERAEQLVTEYHGAANERELARARLWSLMSKYGWSLWGAIRIGSTGDPEIVEWTRAMWARAVAEFDSPEFDRLLEQAAGTR